MLERGDVSDAYVQKYYQVFLKFLDAIGNYREIVSIGENAADGVYPVQVVARKYGYEGAALDRAIDDLDRKRWDWLDELNYWSTKTGLGRMDREGKERVLKFLEKPERRRYFRDNIRRASDKGELLSVRDLVIKRLTIEKKNNQKKEGG